jgi:hypothetical protein
MKSRSGRRGLAVLLAVAGAIIAFYGVAYGTTCTTLLDPGGCRYDLLWLGLLLLAVGCTSIYFGIRSWIRT